MVFRPTDLEDAQGRTQVTLKEEGGLGSLGPTDSLPQPGCPSSQDSQSETV